MIRKQEIVSGLWEMREAVQEDETRKGGVREQGFGESLEELYGRMERLNEDGRDYGQC